MWISGRNLQTRDVDIGRYVWEDEVSVMHAKDSHIVACDGQSLVSPQAERFSLVIITHYSEN